MPQLPVPDPNFRRWQEVPPDPLDYPEFYEGIVLRRVLAHLLDLFLITLLLMALAVFFFVLGILSLGLLWLPVLAASPLIVVAYDALQVGGRRSATLGMRAFGLEVRSWSGARPELAQAVLRALLFWGLAYMTATLLMWLVLGVAFFDARRRCLHDCLSGTVVIRTQRRVMLGAVTP